MDSELRSCGVAGDRYRYNEESVERFRRNPLILVLAILRVFRLVGPDFSQIERVCVGMRRTRSTEKAQRGRRFVETNKYKNLFRRYESLGD